MIRKLSLLAVALGTGFGLTQSQTKALLGQKLLVPVNTGEGPVPTATGVENAPFCKMYACIGTDGFFGDTGDMVWLVTGREMQRRSDEVISASEKGKFYPELTIHAEKNVVTFTDLMFDTAVRKSLPAGTLNLLGNFTRLVLGAPISGQKLSACYRTLQTEARCTVGGGKIKLANGSTRTFKAWFRTVDDGAGYARVNYAIELED